MPNFRKVIGQLRQTEVIPPVQSAKKLSQSKESKPKLKDERKEAKKGAKEPEKPKEAEEETPKPKPKPKNILDLLPPRVYSNTKTNFREVAIKGFWDMYDPEGYSLWFCDYKYNDENTVSFVTLNKVNGFLQQMDLDGFGSQLYEWTEVDVSDEVQKERVNQMIEDCELFEGEALLDAKRWLETEWRGQELLWRSGTGNAITEEESEVGEGDGEV
ncbi:hypothetical protein VNO78_34674 [Psophocarpus tetragonolobus]|uniref:EF-1-gamma C-terminal domain-containing protein n=1 Tax=Psophocarpus tetragonolobus TaxID=3891 RepID=A0AAN9NPW3_PSOTE